MTDSSIDPARGPGTRRINPLARFAVERRVTMGMAVLGVLVLGWISLNRLPLEFLPSFSSSNISVTATYPSSSPEEIERLIVRTLEDSLGTINGIETLSSSSTATEGRVSLSFVDGTDMDMAAVEVRDRVDRVRHLLPDDLDRVNIRRFQSTDIPVVAFHLSAPWEQDRLYDFAENVLQRRLERLEGVAQVNLRGLLTPELQVSLDPDRMRAHGVDVRELSSRLRSNNVNMAGGEIRERGRKLLVRSLGELRTLEEIRRLPLDDHGLTLGDVAEVAYAFPEKESFNFLNGVEAVTVSVNKASTSNLLAVVDRIKAELGAIRQLPEAEGLSVRIYHDASVDVRQGLSQLSNAGMVGGGLAILAVFFFLRRVRTTLLVAVAIPISVVASFVIMYLLRQSGTLEITLNVVSLTGLMLALGMLVDNSIVVIESIFRYRNELGRGAVDSALVGTSEVALPIIASTATTMCVFVPLIFLAAGGGGFTRFLNDVGVTICIAIVASLLVALTVVPLVATLLLERYTPSPRSRLIDGLTHAYTRTLAFTLRHRLIFLLLVGAMLYGSWWLFSGIERTFSARTLERQVSIYVDTPRQYSLAQTAALHREIYQLLDSRRDELGIADISNSYNRGTGRSRGGWSRSRRFEIYLKDEGETDLSTSEAQNRIRKLLPIKAGVNLRIAQAAGHGGGGGIEVELSGDDPTVLRLMAQEVTANLSGLPMIKDVDTSLESGDEEIRVQVDRERILQAGLSSQAVAFTVSNALSSRAVSRFKTEDREVDLVMQYRPEERETLEQLKNVPVFASGAAVPLGAFADFELVAGPTTLERENRRPKVSITANTTNPRAARGAMEAVGAGMSRLSLPPGYSWSFGRWTRHHQQDEGKASFALAFAVVLIYLLMAALFESFAQPLTILVSIPFAFIGVGVVMKLAGQPRDDMTEIGLIILVGVVVNNAIVLLDHINQLRRDEGLTVTEAILQGGSHRLRPILMTAVTTILGLFPMVAPFFLPQLFGTVEGRAAQWAPVGLVILGGLTTSTFLTLMIIPTLYSLVEDLTGFLRRVVRAV